MGFVILLIVAAGGLILFGRALPAILKLLWRLVKIGAVSLFVGVVVGLVGAAGGLDGAPLLGLVGGCLAAIIMLVRRPSSGSARRNLIELAPSKPRPMPSRAAVDAAWKRVEHLFPDSNATFAGIRADCTRVLENAENGRGGERMTHAAEKICRLVPDLVDSTAELIDDVPHSEAFELLHDLLGSLQSLGDEAGDALEELRNERRANLSRAHQWTRKRA
jgi:hypothetical protein